MFRTNFNPNPVQMVEMVRLEIQLRKKERDVLPRSNELFLFTCMVVYGLFKRLYGCLWPI